MPREKTRESWIDIVKGMAIVFVVMGHVVTSYRNSNMLTETVVFNFICDFLYVFHMPLFFVISGYLNGRYQKEETLRVALVRKCVAYGIPYVVFSIVAVGLNIVASSVVNTKLNITDLLLIVIYPISSLWFIYALLIVSVIQLFIKNVCNGQKARIVLLAVAMVVKMGAHFVSGLQIVKASGFSQCVLFDAGRYWFWYVLGECAVSIGFVERRRTLKEIPNWLCAVVTVLYIGAVYMLQKLGMNLSHFYFVLPLIGVILCCIWAMKISQSRLLEYLGKQTLPIYLLHGYVISFVRIVLTKLRIPFLEGFVPMLLCTVLGVVLPLLAYEISARIRGLDFVFYPGKYILSRQPGCKKRV